MRRVKNLSILIWWQALLLALEITATILDHAHHLEWGILGTLFLKACYLGFASVLFFRFLSFRSQKAYENLLASYQSIVGTALEDKGLRKDSWVTPFLLLVMVVVSSMDFTLIFHWTSNVYRISIVLDCIIWLLAMRWVTRTYWLKSMGRRERIKELLDDSRSKSNPQGSEPSKVVAAKVSGLPFGAIAALAIIANVGLSGFRLTQAERTFRVDNLKACMMECLNIAAERYYQQGQWDGGLATEPCLRDQGTQLLFSLNLRRGEVLLRTMEKDSSDYFEDGLNGNQGLVLEPNGGFTKVERLKAAKP